MTTKARFESLHFETMDVDEQLRRSRVHKQRMLTRRTVRDFSARTV